MRDTIVSHMRFVAHTRSSPPDTSSNGPDDRSTWIDSRSTAARLSRPRSLPGRMHTPRSDTIGATSDGNGTNGTGTPLCVQLEHGRPGVEKSSPIQTTLLGVYAT